MSKKEKIASFAPKNRDFLAMTSLRTDEGGEAISYRSLKVVVDELEN